MIKTRICLLLLSVLFLACEKVDELKEFSIEQESEFTIPATGVGPVPIPTTAVQNNAEQEFESNGADIKYVEKIRLSSLKLTITNPVTEDFSFLNSIHIYMEATGLPKVKIAYKDIVPENVSSFDLETTGAILDEYLKQDSYSLIYETVTDELTTQDVTIRSDMVFQVKAKIL